MSHGVGAGHSRRMSAPIAELWRRRDPVGAAWRVRPSGPDPWAGNGLRHNSPPLLFPRWNAAVTTAEGLSPAPSSCGHRRHGARLSGLSAGAKQGGYTGKSEDATGKHPPPSVYHTFVRTITRELTCFCSFHDILAEKTQTVRPLFFRWGGEGVRGCEEYNLSRSPRGPPLFPLPLPSWSLKSPILLHPRAQAAPKPRRGPCIHTHAPAPL